jgi:hypothetical protein
MRDKASLLSNKNLTFLSRLSIYLSMRLVLSVLATVGATLLSILPAKAEDSKYAEGPAPQAMAAKIKNYTSAKKVTKTDTGTTHTISGFPRLDYARPQGAFHYGPFGWKRVEHAEYHDEGNDGWGPGDYVLIMNNDRETQTQYRTVDGKKVDTGKLAMRGPGSNIRRAWRTQVDVQGNEVNTVRIETHDEDPWKDSLDPISEGKWEPVVDGTGNSSMIQYGVERWHTNWYLDNEPVGEKWFADKAKREAEESKAVQE